MKRGGYTNEVRARLRRNFMKEEFSTEVLFTRDTGQVNYMSFLLRCWQEAGAAAEGMPIWRFTLVKLEGSQSKRGFADLTALFAHLENELAAQALEKGV